MAIGTARSQTGSSEFRNSVAVVIGIDRYAHGIPELRTAVADARRVGEILESGHGYQVRDFLDETASLEALTHLFTKQLPAELGPDDRLFLYYAGHGVALDGDQGPNGYLLPQDARRGEESSFLHMPLLHDALLDLKCRHLLVVFDSCFSGAFRWSSTRGVILGLPDVIHKERYDRFISDPAWQVISSAAHDQTALDQLTTGSLGGRGEDGAHSPFALALFEALEGAGDVVPAGGGDGVITATELYLYLEQRLQPETLNQGLRQTPRLWPLKKHDKGEFIFLVPGHELNLPPAPPLTYENNPYRGLQSYDQSHASLFFGRTAEIEQLRAHLTTRPLTVVVGASGTGKSSLVKAGLLPGLAASEQERWHILPVVRPGASPLRSFAATVGATRSDGEGIEPSVEGILTALAQAIERHPDERLLLVVDQLEEVVTLSRSDEGRQQFLELLARIVTDLGDQVRLILTLRSDFELSFLDSPLGTLWGPARFVVPPMDLDDLRAVIEGPASQRVLYFEAPELIDALVGEVLQSPGALPLLSFTLSEMYIRYVDRRSDDRALTWQDYNDLGGVVGALRFRAREEYNELDEAHRDMMRLVLLRMVAFERGSLARRRVSKAELEYPTEDQNQRAQAVIRRLSDQRLLVEGTDESGDDYVEPAHDALVVAWDQLHTWIQEEERGLADLHFQRRLADDAAEWEKDMRGGRSLLWDEGARAAVLGRLTRKKLRAGWLNRRELEFAYKSMQRWKLFLSGAIVAGLVVLGLAISTAVGFVQRGSALQAAADSAAVAQVQRDSARVSAEVARAQRDTAQIARRAAADSAAVAQAQRDTALVAQNRALVRAASAQVREELERGTLLRAIQIARETLRRFPDDPVSESAVLAVAAHSTASLGAIRSSQRIKAESFSPDGRLLATVRQDGEGDPQFQLVDLVSNVIDTRGNVSSAVFVGGGNRLSLQSGYDRAPTSMVITLHTDEVLECNGSTLYRILELGPDSIVQHDFLGDFTPSIASDGSTFMGCAGWVLSSSTLDPSQEFNVEIPGVEMVAALPGGGRFLAVVRDSTRLYDLRGALLNRWVGRNPMVSPDGEYVLLAHPDSTADVTRIQALDRSDSAIIVGTATAWASDSRHFLVQEAGESRCVSLWLVSGSKRSSICDVVRDSASVFSSSVTLSLEHQVLAATRSESSTAIFNFDGHTLAHLPGSGAAFAPTIPIATTRIDGVQQLWDLRRLEVAAVPSQLLRLQGVDSATLSFLVDGLSGPRSGIVFAYSHEQYLMSVSPGAAPWGDFYLSFNVDPPVQLQFDGCIMQWIGSSIELRSVQFGCRNGSVYVVDERGDSTSWSGSGLKPLGSAYGTPSSDGLRFLSGGAGGVADVWERGRAAPIATFAPHDGRVVGGNFLKNDSGVVTLDERGVARVWSMDGTLRQTMSLADTITKLAITPDGTRLAAMSASGRIRTWIIDASEFLDSYHWVPELTPTELAELFP